MNKTLVFFLFIVFIIIILLVILYVLYEKPKQNEISTPMINLTIYSFDYYTEKQISTDFLIYKNNNLFYNGTTVLNGGLRVPVPINNTYQIQTINNGYYTNYLTLPLYTDNLLPKRIDLNLKEPGNLSATITPTQLTLATINDRDIENILICDKWSVNIVALTISGSNFSLNQIPTVNGYDNYDKCYVIGTITKANPLIIYFSPTAYIEKTNYDYINFTIMDQDCYNNACNLRNTMTTVQVNPFEQS